MQDRDSNKGFSYISGINTKLIIKNSKFFLLLIAIFAFSPLLFSSVKASAPYPTTITFVTGSENLGAPALSPNNGTLYVEGAIGDVGAIYVINTSTGSIVKRFNIAGATTIDAVTTSENGNTLYASSGSYIYMLNSTSGIIENSTNIPSCPVPLLISQGLLYSGAGNCGNAYISVLNPNSLSLDKQLALNASFSNNVENFGFSTNGNTLYASVTQETQSPFGLSEPIYVINTSSMTVSTIIYPGDSSFGSPVIPVRGYLYTSNSIGFIQINTSTYSIGNAIQAKNFTLENFFYPENGNVLYSFGINDTGFAHVAQIYKLNITSNTLISSTNLPISSERGFGGSLYGLVDKNSNTIYATGGPNIYLLNASNYHIDNVISTGILGFTPPVFSSSGNIYVGTSNFGTIYRIDNITNSSVGQININSSSIFGLESSPDSSMLYAEGARNISTAPYIQRNIYVINTATNTVSNTVTNQNLTSSSISLISPNGKAIFIAGGGSSESENILVFNTASDTFTNSITTGIQQYIDSLAVLPNESMLYAGNMSSGNILQINLGTNTVVNKIQTSLPSISFLVVSSNMLYAGSSSSGNVIPVNTITGSIGSNIVTNSSYDLSSLVLSPNSSIIYAEDSNDKIYPISSSGNVLSPISTKFSFTNFIPKYNNIYFDSGTYQNTQESNIIVTTSLSAPKIIVPSNSSDIHIDNGQSIVLNAVWSGGLPGYNAILYSSTSGLCNPSSTLVKTLINLNSENTTFNSIAPSSNTLYCILVQSPNYMNQSKISSAVSVIVNPKLGSPSLTSNLTFPATLDAGQTIIGRSSWTGGTSPYSENFIISNSITGNIIGSAFYSGISSNSFNVSWVIPADDAGNTIEANVILYDSALTPEVTNSVMVKTILIDNGLVASAIISDKNVINEGSSALLYANASGGTPPYHYQWYAGSSCNNPVAGSTANTLSVSPAGSTTYTYEVNDSASISDSECSPPFSLEVIAPKTSVQPIDTGGVVQTIPSTQSLKTIQKPSIINKTNGYFISGAGENSTFNITLTDKDFNFTINKISNSSADIEINNNSYSIAVGKYITISSISNPQFSYILNLSGISYSKGRNALSFYLISMRKEYLFNFTGFPLSQKIITYNSIPNIIDIEDINTTLTIIPSNSQNQHLTVSNETPGRFMPKLPPGFKTLLSLNVSLDNSTANTTITMAYNYNCSINPQDLKPFILTNSSWFPLKSSVNLTRCDITFTIPADPVISIGYYSGIVNITKPVTTNTTLKNNTATTPKTASNVSSGNLDITIVVLAVIILIIIIYLFKKRKITT